MGVVPDLLKTIGCQPTPPFFWVNPPPPLSKKNKDDCSLSCFRCSCGSCRCLFDGFMEAARLIHGRYEGTTDGETCVWHQGMMHSEMSCSAAHSVHFVVLSVPFVGFSTYLSVCLLQEPLYSVQSPARPEWIHTALVLQSVRSHHRSLIQVGP